MTLISVIICTHNPRKDYLTEVLQALRMQSLPSDSWELVVVDNASDQSLAEQWDLSWHPMGKVVQEEQLGLTAARLRGIAEASGELIVFIDDDNVLRRNYLEVAMEISHTHPWVGAFGGNSLPRFEKEPEEMVKPVLPELALRKIESAVWAMGKGTEAKRFCPYGAGMVVHYGVARDYAERCIREPIRQELGRKGHSLSSCEDLDLALCSCRSGLAVGLFPELEIEHLIPSARVEPEYLLRLTEGNAESHILMDFLYGKMPPPPQQPCRSDQLLAWWKKLRSTEPSMGQKFFSDVLEARARGRGRGEARVRQLEASGLRPEL
jgi:hypothetical protein